MIAEFIMSRCEWEAVWSPDWHFLRPDAVFVGTWTGPDGDFLCVRRCSTAEEAERWLSPPAPTILLATLRALGVRWGNRPAPPPIVHVAGDDGHPLCGGSLRRRWYSRRARKIASLSEATSAWSQVVLFDKATCAECRDRYAQEHALPNKNS